MDTITLSTSRRMELVDITAQVAQCAASWPQAGALVVFSPHTTAGLCINEGADPNVARDVLAHLSHLVPEGGGFRHAEGNADAHIKTILTGASVLVLTHHGQLRLGTWQRIFLAEWDGPRRRTLWVQPLAGLAKDGEYLAQP
jgi:secondary thiamine-phosphate synthase enzyme